MRFFICFVTVGILLSTIVALPVRRKKGFQTPASFRLLPQQPDRRRVFQCNRADCHKEFTEPTATLSKLEAHERTHTKPFRCDKDGCEAAFAEPSKLQQHKKSIMMHKPDPEEVAKAKKTVKWDPERGTRRLTPGRE